MHQADKEKKKTTKNTNRKQGDAVPPSNSWQYFIIKAQLIKLFHPLIISIQPSNCTVGWSFTT